MTEILNYLSSLSIRLRAAWRILSGRSGIVLLDDGDTMNSMVIDSRRDLVAILIANYIHAHFNDEETNLLFKTIQDAKAQH